MGGRRAGAQGTPLIAQAVWDRWRQRAAREVAERQRRVDQRVAAGLVSSSPSPLAEPGAPDMCLALSLFPRPCSDVGVGFTPFQLRPPRRLLLQPSGADPNLL